MIIKRYVVNNMSEAMTRIRYELGKDAVIVSQRKIRKPGLAGFFSKKKIEVTVAVEQYEQTSQEKEIPPQPMEAFKEIIDRVREKEVEQQAERKVEQQKEKPTSFVKEAEEKANDSETLLKEMQEMKNMLHHMTEGKYPAVAKSELEQRLQEVDIEQELIEKIALKMKLSEETGTEREKLHSILGEMISMATPKMEGVVALVGPTGVGKTTTIAKLAGKLALMEKKKVGLITVDTYRIGAVEQLKTYADIMNIPFKVVMNIKEMETAIESMKDCEVILVDTTGRSSKNTMQISELRAYIEKTHTDNIHLVISSTTKNKDVQKIVEGYSILNYNYILVTKLDETTTYGSILNILQQGKKPLSYVTVGQNVPEDIKQFSKDEMISFILGEDSIC